MRFIEAADFTVDCPWDALDVVTMTGAINVRLYWSGQPYKWHISDGGEVFVVVDGVVDIHCRDARQEYVRALTSDIICLVEAGDKHVAHPWGETRMLVIEKEGSV